MRLRAHLDGYRGGFLATLIIPWMIVGYSYITVETQARTAAFSWLPPWIDEDNIGWLWVASSVALTVCVISGRLHPTWTTAGFLIGLAPPLVWSMIYLNSWVLTGQSTGLASTAVYGAFAAIIFYCSGWPNQAGEE